MNGHPSIIHSLGYRTLPDGGREFDFSLEIGGGEQATMVTIDAPITFFRGPGC